MPRSFLRGCAAGASMLALAATASAEIAFEEVTAAAGIDYTGPSWGSAWGDFNGDGRPDLWMTNHQNAPRLYINQPDGTFVDIAAQIDALTAIDKHGSLWVDTDGDGDQDLLTVVDGGTIPNEPNMMLENLDGLTFQDIAPQTGLALGPQRGRMPLMLDQNDDGRIDFLINSSTTPSVPESETALFRQNADGTFENVSAAVGLEPAETIHFAIYSDVTGDGHLDVLMRGRTFPLHVWDVSAVPFVDRGVGLVPRIGGVLDAVVADFSGDLVPEMYLVRGEAEDELLQPQPTEVEAHLQVKAGTEEHGFDLTTSGTLSVVLEPRWLFLTTNTPTLLGAGAIQQNPPLNLDPADETLWGLPPYTPGEKGHFIGFDPASEQWTFRFSGLGYAVNVVVNSTEEITGLTPSGFDPDLPPPDDVVLRRVGSLYLDRTVESGITAPSSGRGIVAADFDNDMDLDVFILATGQTRNRPNIVLENLGDGTFVPVAGGAGAAGTDQGHGESATIADYDLDGYVDVFVVNGKSKPPFDADGPAQLFRNLGGSNNWIELDLAGSVSNPGGVGSRVLLTAGGRTQLREQGGGVHGRAQDHQRLHFGLADSEVIDSIEIHWPSGAVQQLTDVAVNQILTVEEPADVDGDGVLDADDNCLGLANADQRDSDGDGLGNVCDADIARPNDCFVNFADLGTLQLAFLSAPGDELWNADADFDGDELVNFTDLALMKQAFFAPPGPSGLAADCEAPQQPGRGALQ